MESNIQYVLSKKRATNDKNQRINNKQNFKICLKPTELREKTYKSSQDLKTEQTTGLKERAKGLLEKAKNSIGKEQQRTEQKTRGLGEKATNNRT